MTSTVSVSALGPADCAVNDGAERPGSKTDGLGHSPLILM